jgi:hypothetical protein
MTIPLIAVAAAILVVLTFGEFVMVHYLPRVARYTGFSLASLGGDLAIRDAEIPTELAGLEVSRLDDRTYLVETRDAFSGGTLADANASGLAFAIVEVEGRRWTMDVRANRGYQLVWVVAPFVGIWAAVTQHLPMAARVGVLIFSALGPFALLDWRRKVRARFSAAAQELGSVHTAQVPAAARSL